MTSATSAICVKVFSTTNIATAPLCIEEKVPDDTPPPPPWSVDETTGHTATSAIALLVAAWIATAPPSERPKSTTGHSLSSGWSKTVQVMNMASRLPKIAAVDALDAHHDWNRKRKRKRQKMTEFFLFFFSVSKSVVIWRAVSVRF